MIAVPFYLFAYYFSDFLLSSSTFFFISSTAKLETPFKA